MKTKLKTLLRFKTEILAGLITSFAIIPEVSGFALLAHFSPVAGLYTAFILGLIAALFGGRGGLISAGAGSMAVVAVHLSISHGTEYVLAAGILAGLIQLLFGLAGFAKLLRLIPQTAIHGFVNGLAIVIFSAQLQFFKGEGVIMYVLVGLTILICALLPRFFKMIPAGLIAVIVLGLWVHYGALETKTIADLADISGSLPSFAVPKIPFDLATLKIIAPYALILALVGLIESLLTFSLLNELSPQPKISATKECLAQGAGNTLCGFFGAMSGCVMIGQTMINLTSGGLGRLSGAAAAIFVLIFVTAIPKLIGAIPMGVLVGIMCVVSYKTFEWSTFSRLRTQSKADNLVLIGVTIITVLFDLATAVILGMLFSALVFAYQHSKLSAKVSFSEDGTKIYHLKGSLFFGSCESFCNDIFDVENDPAKVILELSEVGIYDSSAKAAIDKMISAYASAQKILEVKFN